MSIARRLIRRGSRQRRAGVVVQMALGVTFMMGFAALSVDVSKLYVAKTELQRAADSAAMAAATWLSRSDDPDMEQKLREAAEYYAERNSVLGVRAGLDFASDVVLGHAVLNDLEGRYEFQPELRPYDAVRVTVRRSEGSSAGPIELGLARLFGRSKKDLEAQATAMIVPRDVAVVIDLSGSMDYDSQMRYYNRTDGGYSNARDVWCALDGPEPSRPYIPGAETETEYADDTGPTIGVMSQWGHPLVGGYSPSSDPGLWYIRKTYSQSSNTAIINSLTLRGYNSAERSAITSGSRDSSNNSHWQRRCGVMLGLASWRSGKSGGFSGGNGDDVLDAGEVSWIPLPSYWVGGSWTGLIDWVQSGPTHSAFRYRYGLKTYTDYLLQARRQYNQTNNLWATPELPITAVKDAVQTFVDVIASEQDNLDLVSLQVFATTARQEIALTHDYQSIADTLYQRQAGHYDGTTNIGDGLKLAIDELKYSERARDNASKLIVLMSDGVPNVGEGGVSGDEAGIAWALAQAERAADEGITILCVSVGYGVDRAVMQEIASIAHGQEFYAAGNPEEYTQELQTIFRTLGGKREVALIK